MRRATFQRPSTSTAYPTRSFRISPWPGMVIENCTMAWVASMNRVASTLIVVPASCSVVYPKRAALVLQFYEGLPQSEIAQVLRCREGTVASLVHRGLTQLRRVIER